MADSNSTLSPEALAMVQHMHEMAARFIERHEAGEATYADQVEAFLAQVREIVGDNDKFLSSSRRLLDTLGPEEFGPAIDPDMVTRIEADAASQDLAITRRVALSICSAGSGAALRFAGEARPAFAKTLAKLREYREHLALMTEITETAEARLLWAGEERGTLPNGWQVVDGGQS